MPAVNYAHQGDGPPVILIHGIAASLHDWNDIAPQLAASGYRTYALDLLGHGDSIKPDDRESYHVEPIYRHLEAWIDGLQLQEPPLLVGHSLGGYLSLMHALRHPADVRGLVLINPFYSADQLSPVLKLVRQRPLMGEQTLQAIPEWLFFHITGWDPLTRSSLSTRARRQIAIDYKRASPKLIYITSEIPDLTPLLAQVQTPSLVIWGDSDRTLAPASFNSLVQALPRASAHPVPGSGHQPHIGEHQLVTRLTLEFMTGLSQPAGPV